MATKRYLNWDLVQATERTDYYRVFVRNFDGQEYSLLGEWEAPPVDIWQSVVQINAQKVFVQVCAVDELGNEGFHSDDFLLVIPLPAPKNVRFEQ